MKMSHLKKYNNFIKTRLGFFSMLIGLLWLKNMFAYVVDFHLGVQSPMQLFILVINPLSVSMLLLSIGLFIKRSKVAYGTLVVIYALLTIWLFSNAVYYREFTDFITINTMLGAGQVSTGLGKALFACSAGMMFFISQIYCYYQCCCSREKFLWMLNIRDFVKLQPCLPCLY